jgi:DNA-binding CsgD family transcriptional regulator
VDLSEKVAAACAKPSSAKALREDLLQVLRRAVPFEGYNAPLTDPVTRVATSPLADVPRLEWSALPGLIRRRYLTEVCRWDRVEGATSLWRETRGRPEDSLLWREVQRPLGVTDTAIVALADRHGLWGVLDLWRYGGEPFSDDELTALAAVVKPVTAALRGAVARTFVDAGDRLLPVGAAVVVLDADLRVRNQTEAAAEALLRLNPPGEPMAPIPAAAYNIAAALIAEEQGMPIGPVRSRIHLGGNRWVTAKASRLGEDIAVSFEPSTLTERLDLYARACDLTPREAEVLELLCRGRSTREIAAELVVSEHTGADHVKAVLAKTGAPTRQVLLARASGLR